MVPNPFGHIILYTEYIEYKLFQPPRNATHLGPLKKGRVWAQGCGAESPGFLKIRGGYQGYVAFKG